MKKLKIIGPDAEAFADRLMEIAGNENLKATSIVILKCRHGAKLSYDQIERILTGGQYDVTIKQSKKGKK